MKYRANVSPFHGRRHVGDFPTFEAAAAAASCSHPGDRLNVCRCAGGSVVAVLETAADRALVAETVDGMRYAYTPGNFAVEIPLPFVALDGEEPER